MRRTHSAFAAMMVSVGMSACSTVGYPVPGELSTAPPLVVSGRQGVLINQRLSFGGYTTGEVKRSFTRGTEQSGEFATDHGEYRQRYEFALSHIDIKVADVRCNAEGSGAQTLNVVWRSKRTLQCDVEMPGVLRVVRLESSRDEPLSGRVTGDPALVVTGSDRVKGGRIDGTAGYTIAHDNGTLLAAVDVSNAGTVYLPGEDSVVAAVAAALLLYQDPLEASPRFRR